MENIKDIEKIGLAELILNKVNVIAISYDNKGNITYISPQTEKITGYKTNELLGENWWDLTFFTKEEGQFYKDKIKAFASGLKEFDPTAYERKFRCKDGSYKWIEWRNSQGEKNSYVSVGVDITDWKKTEEVNIRFEAILNRIDSILLVSNYNGDVIFASPSVEKMIGYRVDEIMGDRWWQLTYKDAHEAAWMKSAIRKFVFNKHRDLTDITKQEIRTKNGDYKWIEWQISEGVDNTYISIGTDITERVISDIELKNAKEAAEESLKVKNQFLANMSHEIRTPLNAVIGFTDLLLETNLNTEQFEHLETMKNSGAILLTLINNVLDLSKLESEKLEIEHIPFNLHKSFYETARLMKIKADSKNIVLDLIIEPGTPELVIGDPTKLGQILLNLIGNAIKFTDEGSVVVKVKALSETEDSADIYIEIKDTGIGIVSNKINTVFGAFNQAKSDTSRIYGGTGLGLTIVKKLVGLLKGQIKVESKFGEGSNFKFILPFQKSKVDQNKQHENAKEVCMEAPLDLNILLVEDNKTNQLLAKTRLERWNCTVDIANNGFEGVKKTQNKFYDIILMDIQMPVMDGYEATKIIKNDISEQVSKIPVVAMTAYASNTDIKKARNSGMDDYIFKPFKPEELYALLEKYGKLSKRRRSEKMTVQNKPEEALVNYEYIDLHYIRKETLGEKSIIVHLIELFIKDFDIFLEESIKEMEHQNGEVLHQMTHKIKPNVSMFGIKKMEPLIQSLHDNFLKKEALEDAEELLKLCASIYQYAKKELLTELNLLRNE